MTTYQDMRKAARKALLRSEKTRLARVLRSNGWSPQATAMELDISTATLYRAIARHPLLDAEFRKKSPPPGRQKK